MTKFTPAQQAFLHSLDEEPGYWAECEGHEWRTAISLAAKGLVEIDRPLTDRVGLYDRFEARTKSVVNMNNGVRDLPFGGHCFVMARPIQGDWKDYDGTTSKQGRQEFRPCMIQGQETGQRIYVIGSQYAYDLTKFEIREFEAFSMADRPIENDLLYKVLKNGEAGTEEQADAADWLKRLAGQ